MLTKGIWLETKLVQTMNANDCKQLRETDAIFSGLLHGINVKPVDFPFDICFQRGAWHGAGGNLMHTLLAYSLRYA
jgi:hypothetical protein